MRGPLSVRRRRRSLFIFHGKVSAVRPQSEQKSEQRAAELPQTALLCSALLSLSLSLSLARARALSFSLAPSAPLCLPLSDVNRVNRDGTRGNNVYERELYYVGSIREGQKITSDPANPDPSFRGRTDAGLQPPVANICSRTCAFAPPHMHPGRVIRSHGHRIDFCGSAAFYQSCYLSIDAVRNNN